MCVSCIRCYDIGKTLNCARLVQHYSFCQTCLSQFKTVRLIVPLRPNVTHLNGVHDPVSQHGHFSSHGLHALLKLGHVRSRGKHTLESWSPYRTHKHNSISISTRGLSFNCKQYSIKQWRSPVERLLPSPNRSAELIDVLPDMLSRRALASYWNTH